MRHGVAEIGEALVVLFPQLLLHNGHQGVDVRTAIVSAIGIRPAYRHDLVLRQDSIGQLSDQVIELFVLDTALPVRVISAEEAAKVLGFCLCYSKQFI